MVRRVWKLGTLTGKTLNKPTSEKLLKSHGQARNRNARENLRQDHSTDFQDVQRFINFLSYMVFGTAGTVFGVYMSGVRIPGGTKKAGGRIRGETKEAGGNNNGK